MLPSLVSRLLGFLQSIELGLELFTLFVVNPWRESNVVKRHRRVGPKLELLAGIFVT